MADALPTKDKETYKSVKMQGAQEVGNSQQARCKTKPSELSCFQITIAQ
jgi:hypothetical protein